MYTTIIFDVDGTLIDTEMAVLSSLQTLLKADYNQEYAMEDLRFVLGIPGADALHQLGISDIEHANDRWNDFMKDYFGSIHVFRGIHELLQGLNSNDINLGIVTSKTREELIHDFIPFGLSKYLAHMVCADDTVRHKPHPEPLLKFIEISNAELNTAIYIGDTRYDYECAREAGIDFGLALWGCNAHEGIHAKYRFEQPQDIMKYIKP